MSSRAVRSTSQGVEDDTEKDTPAGSGADSEQGSDSASAYRENIRKRVSGLCMVPACDQKAVRLCWCSEHAETLLGPVKVKPKRPKQGVLRLR